MKRVALITGGSSGIGRECVKKFAEESYTVVFTYRNKAGADETRSLVKACGKEVEAYYCDMCEVDSIRQAVTGIMRKHGRIDVLVNCAGISNTKPIEEIDVAEWDTMLNTNLRGPFFLTRDIYKIMEKQEYGRIISVTSIAGQRGAFFSGAHYSASKAGLEALVKCFALRGASAGITSNAVSPGRVETPMAAAEGLTKDGIPIGKLALPADIANAVYFLAMEESGYITGMTLDVNGGELMR